MRLFVLEGSKLRNEAAFWQEYLAVVRPDGAEYFGRNLAAFHDAITGGGPGWPGPNCHLRIANHAAAGVGRKFLAAVAAIASGSEDFEFELD